MASRLTSAAAFSLAFAFLGRAEAFPQKAVRTMALDAERFLRVNKSTSGFTPEPRALNMPTEELRLNVVPQALGYLELYRLTRKPRYLEESVARADYLVRNFQTALRRASYDGMLGYALLSVHQAAPSESLKAHGEKVVEQMMALPLEEMRLNTGLMGAMGLAKAYELTPRPEVLEKLSRILDGLAVLQNPDGSFPHAYDGVDLHYSSWMAMQLILIEQCLPADALPQIPRILTRLGPFLRARAASGRPVYEEGGKSYYARATASQPEYDTRGWTNELGYEIFAFRYFGYSREAAALAAFLKRRANAGAFPDKWAYPMDLESAQYPWSIAKQSVVRTSLLFWELAASLNLEQNPAYAGN